MTEPNPDDYERLRIVYRDVTDDLPNGSKHLGEEERVELTDFEFERGDDGTVTKILGTTTDGLDVVCWTTGRKTVRARREDSGTYSINLGWRQRVEGVPA